MKFCRYSRRVLEVSCNSPACSLDARKCYWKYPVDDNVNKHKEEVERSYNNDIFKRYYVKVIFCKSQEHYLEFALNISILGFF